MPVRPRSLIALLAAAALVAGGLVAPIGGDAAQPTAEVAKKKKCKKYKKGPKVLLEDFFFSPAKLKVKKCTKVVYKYPSTAFAPHNAVLTKGPKRVDKKQFKSPTLGFGSKPWKAKFQKPGTYKFVCTFHRTQMRQTVKVKK